MVGLGVGLKGRVTTWLALVLALGMSFSGCSCGRYNQIVTQREAKFQHQVGSVHLAVLAVAPWDDYKNELMPKFNLTCERALEKALPVTGMLNRSALSSHNFSAAIQAMLETPAASGGGGEEGDKEEGKSEGKAEEGQKDQAKSSDKGEQAGQGDATSDKLATLQTLLKSLQEKNTAPATDPILRYLTATAMFQEVKLLERYLNNVPRKQGYIPYIVRMQLTLIPDRRMQPYDAITHIAFLDMPGRGDESVGKQASYNNKARRQGAPSKPEAAPVASHLKVIPLLVTDSLETAFAQRSLDQRQKVLLGLMAKLDKLEGQVGSESVQELLNQFLGLNYNSLFTVGRLNENTLRVRLGAQQVADDKYALMARNHNLTCLVLVPGKSLRQGPLRLHVAGHTLFQHAGTGELPQVRGLDQLAHDGSVCLRGILKAAGAGKDCTECKRWSMEMLGYLADGQVDSFHKKWRECCRQMQGYGPLCERFPGSLWLELGRVQAESRTSYDIIEIARPKPRPLESSALRARGTVLVLDGKEEAQARLVGVNSLPKQLMAYLDGLVNQDQSGSHRWLASGSSYDAASRVLTFKFPSLSKWRVKATPYSQLVMSWPVIKTVLRQGKQVEKEEQATRRLPIKLLAAKQGEGKDAEAFTLAARQNTLVINDKQVAEVELDLSIKKQPEKNTRLALQADNALFASAGSPAGVLAEEKGKTGLTVKKSGVVRLQLKSLAPGSLVKIHRQVGGKTLGNPLVLKVLKVGRQ